MTRHRTRQTAFALLDLMVSVLILGLLLVPLAITRNNVILMAGKTVELRRARALALSKIGEMELRDPADLLDESGDFGEDDPGFVWQTQVEEVMLWDVVGREEPEDEDDTAGTVDDFHSESDTDDEDDPLVIRLTLTVRLVNDETVDDEALDDEVLENPSHRTRPIDRVVIVRYYVKDQDEEEE